MKQAVNRIVNCYGVLNKKEKGKAVLLLTQMTINIFLDLFSLVSLLPVILLFFDPSTLTQSKYYVTLLERADIAPEKAPVVLVLAIFLFFFSKSIFSYFTIRHKAKFMTALAARLSLDSFKENFKKINLEQSHEGSGELLRKVIDIPERFTFQCLGALMSIYSHGLMLLVILSGLIIYKLDVSLLMLLLLTPTISLYTYLLKKNTRNINEELKNRKPELIQSSVEAINGMIEILVSGTKKYFANRFSLANQGFYGSMRRLLSWSNTGSKVMEFNIIFAVCALFIYLKITNTNPESSSVLLSIFTLSSFRLVPSLNSIISSLTTLRAYQHTADILLDMKNSQNSISVETESKVVPSIHNIVFKNVGFSYDQSGFSLYNLSFELPKNQATAIIGKSGSGKSTIIKLLLGLVKAQEGNVLVGQSTIDTFDREEWWKQIAYVPPSAFIFKGSLLNNLTLGNETKGRNEITELLNDLHLGSLLDSLPDGLDSMIDENGGNISSGQRQRIGIARALLQDRPLLIFDEVTNNLDEKSRTAVVDILLSLVNSDKTCIFITHEDSLVAQCNHVIDLDEKQL